MSAVDCTNPFNFDNHNDGNISPLKRVSALIQSHAAALGYELKIGENICDKCRLFARNKYGQKFNIRTNKYPRKRKSKAKVPHDDKNATSSTQTMQQSNEYLMPMSDSSDPNDSSNEPYSDKYHQQRALVENNTAEVGNQFTEYEDDSNDFNSTPKDNTSTSNMTNEHSNSLLTMATINPVSEFKIVAVTSLPAEKHNEIMNNDDNAMDSIYNHQLKINEIISTASNSNVFGIAKKPNHGADTTNSLLTTSSSRKHHQIPNQSMKKQYSKVKNLKQRIQSSFRLPNVHAQRTDEIISASINKESTDSDEHSNSKFNYASKLSRRKDTLQPLLDCEMEFVEVSPPKLKRQAHMTTEQRVLSAQLETVKKIKNPNADLLRKVAFLRVCVNYMMTELEGETFNFGKIITYENLKTKYNSKRLDS